jgi:hypothetical protein
VGNTHCACLPSCARLKPTALWVLTLFLTLNSFPSETPAGQQCLGEAHRFCSSEQRGSGSSRDASQQECCKACLQVLQRARWYATAAPGTFACLPATAGAGTAPPRALLRWPLAPNPRAARSSILCCRPDCRSLGTGGEERHMCLLRGTYGDRVRIVPSRSECKLEGVLHACL